MKRKTMRRVGIGMMAISAVLLVILLTGCASVKPKGSVQGNYAFPFSTDHWQHSDRPWQCEQPQIRVEGCLETRTGWCFGLYHESMLLCGQFNGKPEIYENGMFFEKEWGGWK